MERQKSFITITKPTSKLFLLSFTISSSLLFFFLFSFWVLDTTPSSSSSTQAHHLQFTNGLNAIKAQAFVAFTSNFSAIERKDPILDDAQVRTSVGSYEDASLNHTHQAFIAFSSNFSANDSKDPILGDAQVRTSVDSHEEALGSVIETGNASLNQTHQAFIAFTSNFSADDSKDPILGATHYVEAILNHTHVRSSSENGLDLVVSDNFKANSLMGNESSNKDFVSIEKIENESTCDVFDGKWVLDENYPLYTNYSCPFIDEGFSCESNGRLDRDYMKWRWQPHQCNIPRFKPVKMLELIRGKRLVFVGDSINRNQWESMLCLLRGAISDPRRVYEARGRRITKERGNYNFKFIDYQCSVEYYLSHFLVHESKARVEQKRRKTLRIDAIDRGSSRWKGADIVVFNTAHWWSHYKTKSGLNYYQEGDKVHPHLDPSIAFRRALTTWASWVDRYINPGKTQVFFRSSAPSHFSGGEWNAGGHCRESTQPLNDTRIRNVPEKNLIVEEVVKQMRNPVTILNITNLSGLRIDGHPSVYGSKSLSSRVQDCSHWCLPGVPDTWNELLYFYLLSGHRSVSKS